MYNRLNLIVVTSFLLIVIFFFSLEYYRFIYLFLLSIMTSTLVYFIIKLARVYLSYLYDTLLKRINTKKIFDSQPERYRLFFYLFFGSIAVFILYIFATNKTGQGWFESLYTSLLFIAFSWCIWFMNFTWSDRFEECYLKETPINKNKNLKITNYSRIDLKNLYNNLIDQDFIEIINPDSTINDVNVFADILYNGTIPNTPTFILKMDNIQTKYFWDQLSIKSENFTLDIFLQIFKNNNPNATRQSIEASASKAKNSPKRKKEIDECFIFAKEG